MAALLSACGGSGGGVSSVVPAIGSGTTTTSSGLSCDDSVKTAFKLDAAAVGGDTTLLLVRHFSTDRPAPLFNEKHGLIRLALAPRECR